MGGYIGATAVGLTTTAADVQGDITSTDTTPELILKNTSEEDTEGGREGKITFKGEQSGGEETTLAQIESAHDGTSDDEKGDLIFKTNDGNDGAAPTERLRLDSAGDMLLSSPDPSFTITNTTQEDTDGGRESTIVFKGEQSGGELSTLAEIEASHDGTADDEKGDLIFRTNDGSDGASPTEAMRISSDQKVGIGTNDPSAPLNVSATYASDTTEQVRFQDNTGSKLDFFGNADGDKGIQAYADDGSNFYNLNLQPLGGNVGIGTTSPTTFTGYKTFHLKNGSGNAISLAESDGGVISQIICDDAVGVTIGSRSNHILRVTTNDTERMRLDNAGFVLDPNSIGAHYGIFNTSSSGDGHILLQRSASNKYQLGSDTSNNFFIYNYTASGYALKIDTSNNFFVPTMAVGGTANLHWSSSNGQFFVTSSSKRFKHDIVDYDKGLAEVLQMQPKYFVYNEEPNEKQRAGFIAEDFHDIGMTEYVEYWQDENGEDIPSEIGYSNMVAVLVKAIQELSAKNDALETKVETLETQNTTQATQIADLITRVEALEGA